MVGEPVSMASMKDAQDKDKTPSDIWTDNLMLHYVGKPQPGTDSADETSRRSAIPCVVRGCRSRTNIRGLVGGKVNYCRYTDIYKVAVVGGDAGYLISNIVK